MVAEYSYSDLLDLNSWIRKNSDAFYWQCTARTVQESKLFPVNPYIAMSYLNAWYRYPALLRKLAQHMSPEELGDRAREVSSVANIITNGIMSQFYLGGRQMLIDMGMLRPTDALDDVMYVLDFAKRLNLAYHRNHAHSLPSDANQRAQLLPERVVQVFDADAFAVKPGDRLHTAVVRFLAQISQYAFLSHCECRLGISNSGPYKIGSSAEMLVRDFVDLGEGDFPWLDGVAAPVAHNNYTLPVVLKDTHFNIVDDWASFEATPGYDHDNMIAVGLYTSDYLSDGYVPVAMDNPATLADFLEHEREVLHAATSQLWKVMAEWRREQLLDAGLLVYYSVPKDLFHLAGIYDQDDWMTVEERAQRFKPLMNDEYGRDLIAELVGYISLSSQQGSEYVMSKWSGAPGDMWSTIPYSVLGGYPSTPSVGAPRAGSTSLPPKTSTWTTTAGRLPLAEVNQRARVTRPLAAQEPYRFLDDRWVKDNPDDPRVQELYRHTQASSRLLAGRGAGLTRTDLDALRQADQSA
ncbi:MAG: hypothetical protein ACYCO9_13820 [Streptosporangiaceae bacterium]